MDLNLKRAEVIGEKARDGMSIKLFDRCYQDVPQAHKDQVDNVIIGLILTKDRAEARIIVDRIREDQVCPQCGK